MAKKKRTKTEANERAFVEEYIANGRNATQAYKKFHPRVTDRTATVEGSKLLTKPDVQAYLKKREEALQEKLELTTERVLRELARLSFFDVRKLFNADGTLKAPSELDDDTAAAIASIESEELFEGTGDNRKWKGMVRKVRAFNKHGALQDAMKHLGLFKEDNDQLGKAIARAIIVPAKQDSGKKG